MKKILLMLAALVLFSGTARAADWQVDYDHSTLGFEGNQNGQLFDGAFKKFTAQISFDPDKLDLAKIMVAVDIASATAGDPDRDAMLPQTDWFAASAFPQARFMTTAIRKTGPGSYEAAAKLTIKGITRDVTLPFTLVEEGDHWRMQGRAVVMRNDFSIGQGRFAGEEYVKHQVDVMVDLVARPVP